MVGHLALAGRSAAALEVRMEMEQAWYFLTLLSKIGRPARPAEILSRFRGVPASAEFRCRIPNSPLFLTDGGFVRVSYAVAVAFREFLLWTVPLCVPRMTVRLKKVWDVEDVFSRCTSRKRKERCLLLKAKTKGTAVSRRWVVYVEEAPSCEHRQFPWKPASAASALAAVSLLSSLEEALAIPMEADLWSHFSAASKRNQNALQP